nr:17.7 kDa class I heat shock protein-like [Arachis hypogaea]
MGPTTYVANNNGNPFLSVSCMQLELLDLPGLGALGVAIANGCSVSTGNLAENLCSGPRRRKVILFRAHSVTAVFASPCLRFIKYAIAFTGLFQTEAMKAMLKKNKMDQRNEKSSMSGKFMRRFRLPENAKMNQVKTSMENGVLTVTVPKAEVKKPDVKSIQIIG